jgi:hypothetical protein
MVAQAFDPRIIRLTIEVGNYAKVYEGLYIDASGTRYANPNQNECTVQISNVDKDTRNYILTETSPFNKNRVRKRMRLEAGRRDAGVGIIFEGDIIKADVSQPPDVVLTIKALTGNYDKGNIVQRNGGSATSLKSLSKSVANDLGLQLNFQATDKQIASYSYTGSSIKQVDKLAEAGLVDAYVDNGVLVVKNMNVPLTGNTRILNKGSGMIGIPELTEHGVKATFLLDTQTVVGSGLSIQSDMNPTANGDYAVYKLGFQISNYQEPFYWIAEAVRI